MARKEPVKEKTNVDECTIYVEQLKSDATHDLLESVFAEFGNVVYVSIPKYRHNGAVKGFAFVEFDKEQEAQNALNYFESIGSKMPSNIEPEDLCSITTFEGKSDDQNGKKPKLHQNKVEMKIKTDGGETDIEEKNTKTDAPETTEVQENKKRKFNEVEENGDKVEKKIKTDATETAEVEEVGKKKKKNKKEAKKKNYIKELGFQILSK